MSKTDFTKNNSEKTHNCRALLRSCGHLHGSCMNVNFILHGYCMGIGMDIARSLLRYCLDIACILSNNKTLNYAKEKCSHTCPSFSLFPVFLFS